jgi:nicotinate-nucleotide adenylyltransferase
MKIGLLFGSFNPIHIGHLILANYMAENTALDRVWFVVSPQNPFKKSASLLHHQDRYDLVYLAIGDNYKLQPSNIEFSLPVPSYTIDTLTYFQEKYPEHEFSLILGQDNLATFHKWKNYERILEYHRLYVYPRSGCSSTELEHHPKVTLTQAPLLDISATFIRDMVRAGKSIGYLVPEAVEEAIKRKGFFRTLNKTETDTRMENTATTLKNVWASITGTTTDCEKVVHLLDMIVDGEANPEDQQYFYKHVEECAPCFGILNKEKELKTFLQQSVQRKAVPSHLAVNIKALIEKLPETETV